MTADHARGADDSDHPAGTHQPAEQPAHGTITAPTNADQPGEQQPGHRIVTATALAAPAGYAHAVVAAPGTLVFLGGQTAQGPDGAIRGGTIVEQFDVAAGNVVTALAATGGRPEDLVSLTIYVTDVADYRRWLGDLGVVYRRHFGRHYPAMALLGVNALFDDAALVELVGVAVLPERLASQPVSGGGSLPG
ncbi:MAG: RidA family protein [Acidimicrobiales bacterium]